MTSGACSAIVEDHAKARVRSTLGVCSGISGAFYLWPHTSVDLEAAYENATRAVGTVRSVSGTIEEFLEMRPLVARRHYIETGKLLRSTRASSLIWQGLTHPSWLIGTLVRTFVQHGVPHIENMDATRGPPIISRPNCGACSLMAAGRSAYRPHCGNCSIVASNDFWAISVTGSLRKLSDRISTPQGPR
jgi:hypothetical protein